MTDGDKYLLQYPGKGHLFSTCQNAEKVNGIIDNGVDGGFLVDIPLFSSRPLVHRAKVNAQPIGFEVAKIVINEKKNKRLDELVLKPIKPLPADVDAKLVLFGNRWYQLYEEDGKLVIGDAEPLKRRINLDTGQYYPNWYEDEVLSADGLYIQLKQPLLAYALGIGQVEDLEKFQQPDDRIRVFLYAPMPEEFMLKHEQLGKPRGQVLYVIDVYLPEE